MFGQGGIVKLCVQVCKGSNSPCLIKDKLRVFEVLQVHDIHIGGALVSEERDINQLEKIYTKRLTPLMLRVTSRRCS